MSDFVLNHGTGKETRLYICNQKKDECSRLFCGEGYCYHTGKKKFTKYKMDDQRRKWVRLLKSDPTTLLEVCRECQHNVEQCEFAFQSVDMTGPVYCIRRRCMKVDRKRRKSESMVE